MGDDGASAADMYKLYAQNAHARGRSASAGGKGNMGAQQEQATGHAAGGGVRQAVSTAPSPTVTTTISCHLARETLPTVARTCEEEAKARTEERRSLRKAKKRLASKEDGCRDYEADPDHMCNADCAATVKRCRQAIRKDWLEASAVAREAWVTRREGRPPPCHSFGKQPTGASRPPVVADRWVAESRYLIEERWTNKSSYYPWRKTATSECTEASRPSLNADEIDSRSIYHEHFAWMQDRMEAMGQSASSVNLLDSKAVHFKAEDDGIDGLGGLKEKATVERPHRGPKWAQQRRKKDQTPPHADLPGFYWSGSRNGPLDGLSSPRRYEDTPRWDSWIQRGLSPWGPRMTKSMGK